MTPALSPNAQAILLLTAPLIAGRGASAPDLLSPGEYKRLARHLREIQHQPADLVDQDATSLLRTCQPVIDESRLRGLLSRGFLLSQVIERWQTRAIWVVSRADSNYPRRLKVRLREDAPAVLYGCGDIGVLESGGFAVVGSRKVDDWLIEHTIDVGRLAARAGRTLVSGGAKGIDQAAMRGALEAGGKVCGVLADSLEKTSMNREHRNLLLDGQLTLISPYDPSAGFNVGHAMQRNKLIYALSDASLVVSSDFNKGGTWTGAIEQLDKLKFVPVYVRSTGALTPGLEALRSKGAIPWPNPKDVDSFDTVFDAQVPNPEAASQAGVLQFSSDFGNGGMEPPQKESDTMSSSVATNEPLPIVTPTASAYPAVHAQETPTILTKVSEPKSGVYEAVVQTESNPADVLYSAVRAAIQRLLKVPMKDAEIAATLNVTTAQAKAWLQRLVEEGVIEKQKKPAGYIIKQIRLL